MASFFYIKVICSVWKFRCDVSAVGPVSVFFEVSYSGMEKENGRGIFGTCCPKNPVRGKTMRALGSLEKKTERLSVQAGELQVPNLQSHPGAAYRLACISLLTLSLCGGA